MSFDPLVPDPDTAQSWVLEELARPEYHIPPSPLGRFLRDLFYRLSSIVNTGDGDFPLSAVLMIIFTLLLLALFIIVIVNPIRLRQRRSLSVLDDEDMSLPTSRTNLLEAVQAQDWNNAVIWGFRVLALMLDQQQVLTLSPGVTAQEVSISAGKAYPTYSVHFSAVAQLFDDVRYGEAQADAEGYQQVAALISVFEGGKH